MCQSLTNGVSFQHLMRIIHPNVSVMYIFELCYELDLSDPMKTQLMRLKNRTYTWFQILQSKRISVGNWEDVLNCGVWFMRSVDYLQRLTKKEMQLVVRIPVIESMLACRVCAVQLHFKEGSETSMVLFEGDVQKCMWGFDSVCMNTAVSDGVRRFSFCFFFWGNVKILWFLTDGRGWGHGACVSQSFVVQFMCVCCWGCCARCTTHQTVHVV